MQLKDIKNKIFNIKTQEEFKNITLEIFRLQSQNNLTYKEYLNLLGVNAKEVNSLEQIPFLPIRFFKSKEIVCTEDTNNSVVNKKTQEETQSTSGSIIFTSSTTGGTIPSKHYVSDISIYQNSFTKAFELFYGNPADYTILALLPSYLERQGSSLVYMANELINISRSSNNKSGFYLYNYDELYATLNYLKENSTKTILLGVTFALLDFIEKHKVNFPELIIMETGGMKGRGIELERNQLHKTLSAGFGSTNIHSEYSMAELLSQAYSKSRGIFQCPPWMQIMLRKFQDPFTYHSKADTTHPLGLSTPLGGINIIDLANINSCPFIETEDMGYLFNPDKLSSSFTVEGRIKEAEMRGCNMLLGDIM